MHAMRGSKDLYSRILGGIGKGSKGQTQLQYFNLAMENVLKGLKWQILISVNRDLDFFYFLRFVTRKNRSIGI
jgi:hypothetical protein